VGDLVQQTRSMLQGAMGDPASLLNEPYVAGSGLVKLRYPIRQVAVGSVLTCDLNTWYVLEATADGSSLVVLPGYDGGPDVDVAQGAVCRVRPIFTNWAIFREVSQEIQEMSSTAHGLFHVEEIAYNRNWTDDTYPLPVDMEEPVRLLRGRYRIPGTKAWGQIQNVVYQPEQRMARIFSSVADANTLELAYAMKFTAPTAMSDTLVSLGITGNLANVPSLGAASALALSTEGRRLQPVTQGDPRRAEEVPAGGNVGISRSWEKQKEDMIQAEYARLLREYGWAMPIPEPRPHFRVGGGYVGGGYW
jgi:hypothetical protein